MLFINFYIFYLHLSGGNVIVSLKSVKGHKKDLSRFTQDLFQGQERFTLYLKGIKTRIIPQYSQFYQAQQSPSWEFGPEVVPWFFH
jgi:hypothetical protein